MVPGSAGARGRVMVWKVGWLRWRWSVCIGGATWTDPRDARTRFINRRAARLLVSTVNRPTRRAVGKLNPTAGT